MAHITLTEEQTQLLASTKSSIEVRTSTGQPVAILRPMDPALVATILECKRCQLSPEPRVPSEQVSAHLARLSEIRESEGLDKDKMLDLLQRLRAGEAV